MWERGATEIIRLRCRRSVSWTVCRLQACSWFVKNQQVVSLGYIHFSECLLYFNKNLKKMKPGDFHDGVILFELSDDFIHLHLLCTWPQRVNTIRKEKKKKPQAYLNKWHLQIFNSKNNLMLPGWLAVWEHMYLKLATWFINTWPSRSIKKGRMQIMGDWYLSDRWFLLLMMMTRTSSSSNRTEIKGGMQPSSPQRRHVCK